MSDKLMTMSEAVDWVGRLTELVDCNVFSPAMAAEEITSQLTNFENHGTVEDYLFDVRQEFRRASHKNSRAGGPSPRADKLDLISHDNRRIP
jgi:hypothetical protein